MTNEAGEFAGLDRFAARQEIVKRLTAEGRLAGTDPHLHSLGHCQRCDTVIEPYLSNQWFVKVRPLAEPAIAAVEEGEIRFVPELWTKTYFEWMRNIHDWCISRQLWWGHRIPAFTCENGHLTVSEEDPKACETCGLSKLEQDTDVLDTWFSSQLWPFSVFGWPKETEDLKEFYPTDTLVTGYDILFFWVARMIMAGLHFTGAAPFSAVHLHGLIRFAGEKMSKTRGNVIDPVVAIEEFGADALRFAYASAASSGATVTLERERLSGSRAFATKLWNAARFTLGQLEGKSLPETLEGRDLALPDRWILSRLSATAGEVNRHLSGFRFDEAAQALYAFLWHELCDWYLEMVKPVLSARAGDESARETARAVLRRCLSDSLALLHPFMPFLTEEIWEKLTGRPGTLIVSPYPAGDSAHADSQAEAAVDRLRAIVTRVRNFRGERKAPPTEPVELWVDLKSEGAEPLRDLHVLSALVKHLARLSDLHFGAPPPEAFRDAVAGLSIGLSFPKRAAEADRAKLTKTLADLDSEIESLAGKLHNPSFLRKAPAAVVEKTRRRLVELEQRRTALTPPESS